MDIVDSTYDDALILRKGLFWEDSDRKVSFDEQEALLSVVVFCIVSVATIRAGNPPFVKAFRISSVLVIVLL
jgi:hypothetical protein